MFAIKNLIDKSDMATGQRLSRLKELGIVEKLEAYLSNSRESSRSSEEWVSHTVRLAFNSYYTHKKKYRKNQYILVY